MNNRDIYKPNYFTNFFFVTVLFHQYLKTNMLISNKQKKSWKAVNQDFFVGIKN
jgi:hypothetical protein